MLGRKRAADLRQDAARRREEDKRLDAASASLSAADVSLNAATPRGGSVSQLVRCVVPRADDLAALRRSGLAIKQAHTLVALRDANHARIAEATLPPLALDGTRLTDGVKGRLARCRKTSESTVALTASLDASIASLASTLVQSPSAVLTYVPDEDSGTLKLDAYRPGTGVLQSQHLWLPSARVVRAVAAPASKKPQQGGVVGPLSVARPVLA